MDPTTVCCPHPHCHTRGQTGQGTIGIHAQQEQHFLCHPLIRTHKVMSRKVKQQSGAELLRSRVSSWYV